MNGTVNPFEPWRPVVDRVPPLLHVGRPWRPPAPPPVLAAVEEPPFVEPVKPPTRKKLPQRPKPQKRTGPSPPRRTPISQWTAFAVLMVLGLVCLDSVGWISGTHVPRLMALGVSAGLFVGMAFNLRRDWYTRLTWMTAALSLAGIALWLVPTVHGVSLWSAYRQVERLRAFPPGAIAEYRREAAARRTLVEEFPSFAADVNAAEQAWLRRTVEKAVENADRQLDKDPGSALTCLHQLDKELSQLAHYESVRKEIASARQRAVQACVKVAQQR